jgi:hypothetical protein
MGVCRTEVVVAALVFVSHASAVPLAVAVLALTVVKVVVATAKWFLFRVVWTLVIAFRIRKKPSKNPSFSVVAHKCYHCK